MSEARLKILAVDDEQPQLQDLARLLRDSRIVEHVECASDAHDALVKASADSYDVIFLDVRMPDLDGVELARVLRRFATPPQLVFVSAYDTAAVDAFELHALDYLRKPVARRRLEEALERVAAVTAAGRGGEQVNGDVVAVDNVRTGARRLIARGSILYIQSHGDFVRVISEDGRYLLRTTLTELERRWEPHGFVRVHRQYVANLNKAVEFRPQFGGTPSWPSPTARRSPSPAAT